MRIERYTETYLDDAMRLCRYIAKDDGGVSIVMADPKLFPEPLKGQEFPEPLFAVRAIKEGIIVAECAYLMRRRDGDQDRKFHNRWLTSVKLGEEIRKARESMGMTVEELAGRTGYQDYSILAMEKGRYNMDVRLLGRIADELGCEIKLERK